MLSFTYTDVISLAVRQHTNNAIHYLNLFLYTGFLLVAFIKMVGKLWRESLFMRINCFALYAIDLVQVLMVVCSVSFL